MQSSYFMYKSQKIVKTWLINFAIVSQKLTDKFASISHPLQINKWLKYSDFQQSQLLFALLNFIPVILSPLLPALKTLRTVLVADLKEKKSLPNLIATWIDWLCYNLHIF